MFLSESINRVSEITGKTIPMHVVDILDKKGLQDLFSKVKHIAHVANFNQS